MSKQPLTTIDLRKTDHIKSFGSSMHPFIKDGDVVYYKKTPLNNIAIGDIIVVQSKSSYITHRVVYKTNTYLVTKGDAASTIDTSVYLRNIIGKVYKLKRKGKELSIDMLYLLQSSVYMSCLKSLTKALEKNKLEYVILKGLILHLYYENTYSKHIYADCDILVDKNNLEKAEEALFSIGFKKKKENIKKLQNQLRKPNSLTSYVKIKNGIPISISLYYHPSIAPTQTGHLENLYPHKMLGELTKLILRTRQRVKVYKHNYFIVSKEMLSVYLALHFFHHNFRGFYHLKILDSIITKISLNKNSWDKTISIIKKYNLSNFCWGSYYASKKYYNSPIPNCFLKQIAPSDKYKNFIRKQIDDNHVFKGNDRINDEFRLFKNLFVLSPRVLWYRYLVFFSPIVLYFLLRVLYMYNKNTFYKKHASQYES